MGGSIVLRMANDGKQLRKKTLGAGGDGFQGFIGKQKLPWWKGSGAFAAGSDTSRVYLMFGECNEELRKMKAGKK